MKCLFCKQGETQPGTTVITLTRKNTTVVFKNVPADVCENCGESYVNENVTKDLLKRANEAIRNGAEVEIQRFAA
ncbi:MAG: type II toxin-antitoxin system MqsA family antitoxin [SAR324 cluster bacterium]|nr:type II toxin-antitoxin system MqsA family antitoxin [SAR324 cluster bacterium]